MCDPCLGIDIEISILNWMGNYFMTNCPNNFLCCCKFYIII